LSAELPPFEPPQGTQIDGTEEGRHRRFNLLALSGIAVFGLLTVYVALVVATQVDDLLWPGRQLDVGLPEIIPGVEVNTPEYADINQRINIVVLGLDLRRDEPDDQPARTDSVMILTMDPFSKTGGAFSIPRDTWLEIPDGTGGGECAGRDAPSSCGYVKDRINVAYEMGEYTPRYEDYPGGGAGLVKDTIEHNFGIPIDYYVLLNFNNFIDLIDELDGIEVDVPEYAYDPAYSDCNECYAYPVEFLEGPEHMDGERALAYARIRASDNDFKRIERQQLVVKATARKAADLGTVFSNALSLYQKYKDAVKTDISDFQIGGLADLAKQIGPDNIRTVSMAEATSPCYDCPGAVLLWDEEKVEELKGQVFTDGRLQGDGATVKILNGTQIPDLAGEFASFLRSQGMGSDQITVDEYANGELYTSTIIVDLEGKNYTLDKLREWLDLPQARIKRAVDPGVEAFLETPASIVVVLGADAELPVAGEAANSALADETSGG
jgi:LCP family protein required for cell wall assembly